MRTLSARILVGFVVLILTFGLTTSLVVVYMDQVGDEIRMIRTGFLPLALFSKDFARRQEDLRSYLAEELKDEANLKYAQRNLRKHRGFRDKTLAEVQRTLGGLRDVPERHARRISETKDRLAGLQLAVDSTAPLYDEVLRAPPLTNAITSVDIRERTTATSALAQLITKEQLIVAKAAELADYHRQRVTLTAQNLEETEEGLRTFTIFLGATAILVGLLVTTWVTLALRPLRRLRDAARRIAAGDYQSRIAETGPLEVADLAREFNVMGRAVDERERERVRSERFAAVDKMASMIAHEVRNPLSSIGLNVEMLEEELERLTAGDAASGEEARALCKSTLHEIHRLNSLTEDYLTLARLPKPKLELKPLAPILRDTADFVREDLAKRKVTLSTTFEAEDARAAVDSEQLWQCLLNLIRNAAEAVAQKGGGHVALTLRREAERDGGQVVIDVADDGPGIDPEVLPRLFDPFFSTKKHGSGLGLALTQEIVRDHGGEIKVATEPRRGATFSISLPSSLPAALAAQQASQTSITSQASVASVAYGASMASVASRSASRGSSASIGATAALAGTAASGAYPSTIPPAIEPEPGPDESSELQDVIG
jgi:two-component system, NtrC family, sensor kinase